MHGVSHWASAAVASVESRSAGPPMDRSLRVTVHFHPDHEIDGRHTVEDLVAHGRYRSQFETGTSNGGLTAHRDGDRWRWEQRLFGGAYDDAPAAERPKYGSLNHRRRGVGGSLRFGSAHLRLAQHVLERTTFCFPDSVAEPTHFGTQRSFDLVRWADAFDAGAGQWTDEVEQSEGGLLDDYIEAHVHGVVSIPDDVEAVVLDPCYRDADVADAAWQLGVPLEWHEGRVLTVAELDRHPAFRGPGAVELGRTIARDDRLDARLVGDARRSGRYDPQGLKRVWHLVARFGTAAE